MSGWIPACAGMTGVAIYTARGRAVDCARAVANGGIRFAYGEQSRISNVIKSSLGIISLLLCLAAGPASGDGLTLEGPARALDPSIQSVVTCGSWQYGDRQGEFRVISGWLYGHSELYVQWVADPEWYPKKGQQVRPLPQVMATAVFPELDDYESATYLDNVRCMRTKDGWAVTADAENAHDEGPTATYLLFVYLHDEPGKFRIATRPRHSGAN